MKRSFLFTSCLFLLVFRLPAQFSITYNKQTGAVTAIVNPTDPNKMNWIFSSEDSLLKWQKNDQDWGLGKYDVEALGIKDEKWTVVDKQKIVGNTMSLTYKTKCLSMQVDRQPAGN